MFALNEVSIRDYLHDELNIQQRTKIVNSILKRGFWSWLDRWEAYCEKAGKKIDNKTVFLLSADSDTYAYGRCYCEKRYSY